MKPAPRFPPLYQVVRVERPDSARAHAERLAAQGAEEGTLVLAGGQTEGRGRAGKFWMSGFQNLHLALVLHPEDPLPIGCQLSLVAAVSAAMAISRQAEPMAELGYRWPNDVLLNGGKVAGIHLTGQLDRGGGITWMVISLNVNVYEAPSTEGFAAASMREEGFSKHDRDHLAVAFCQEFLALANRWANEGFAPVRKAWLARRLDEPLAIGVGGQTLGGRFTELDDEGSLLLEAEDGARHTVTLADFFRPEFRDP
ncbi:MAG: biotin--[acetyl-CoA-carboxylase] ligase [Gammaproteobacteria bacterium]|nr:biotin--[acetyl-CoA-carboxylase] ligase [Gammaproteobacteria bacterium]